MMTTNSMRDSSSGGAIISGRARRLLEQVDTVVFDCDGTLIDASESYDATVARTAERMVRGFTGVKLPLRKLAPRLIMLIRRTGGFNNDWDVTYALSMFSVVALSQSGSKGIAKSLDRLATDFASAKRPLRYRSVDDFLAAHPESDEQELAEMRRFMGYPGTESDSRMARVFEETYFGRALFKRTYGEEPRYFRGEGLIERERVLVSRQDLERISSVLGGRRMAISTGRPFVATKHSLQNLTTYFDREASTYIGDADTHPELASELAKYRKPSGASLIRAVERFSSNAVLYVGDSTEDIMMAADAKRSFEKILFAGVYGTASDEKGQMEYFVEEGADITVKTVEQIPEILERAKR
jgi:phosphoglycolate phosphatase-like HAD superfamily hydrolase